MAVLFVADRGSGTPAAIGSITTVTMAAGASISVGSTLFLYVAYDEGTTGTVAVQGVTSGTGGNFWQRLGRVVNDPGGTDTGVVTELWASRTQVPYNNGDGVFVRFTTTAGRGALLVKEFTGVAPNFAVGSGGNTVTPSAGNSIASNTATGNGTTIGPVTVNPGVTGWVVLGAAGIETNTAITGDADTTDGSWSAVGTVLSNSGADATSITVSEQYKVVTGTTTQSWALTKVGAADWGTILVAIPAEGIGTIEQAGGGVRVDNFQRVVAPGGWGTTSGTQQLWTTPEGTAANFQVTGTQGEIAPGVNASHTALIAQPSADIDFVVTVSVNAVSSGSFSTSGPVFRATNSANSYQARVVWGTGGAGATFQFVERTAGVDAVIGNALAFGLYTANTLYNIRVRVRGATMEGKMWDALTAEPAGWQIVATDATLAGPGFYGMRAFRNTGSGNPTIFSFDNLSLVGTTASPGNPNYPCIAGYEGLPTEQTAVPLDTGTGYVFTSSYVYPNGQNSDSLVAAAAFENLKDGLSQHTVTWELAYPSSAVADDEVIQVSVPLAGANTTGSVALPAVTALEAISQIGDGYLRLDAGETVNFWTDFNFVNAYPGYRIVNMGLRYVAWRDDDAYDGQTTGPSVGMKVTWQDLRNSNPALYDTYDYGFWLVPNYRSGMSYETRNLGETNFIPNVPGSGVYGARSRRPFTMRDMFDQGVNGTSFIIECITGSDTSQTVIYFDYIEVVLDIAPERRLAAASTIVSNIPYVFDEVSTDPYRFDDNVRASMFDVGNASYLLAYPYFVAPTFSATNPLMLSVREALPADGSDFFRALVIDPDDPGNTEAKYSGAEAVGQPFRLQALTNLRATQSPYPDIYLGTYVNGLPVNADEFPVIEEYIPAVSLYPAALTISDGYFWPQFNTLGTPLQVLVKAGGSTVTQTQYVVVDGATTFTHVKILAKPDPTQADSTVLTVSVQQPLATPIATATITKAQLDALEDVGNGWKEATLLLSVPVTPAPGQVALVFSASNPSQFYLQGSYPKNVSGGYNNAAPNDDSRPTDSSAVLMCAIPTPSVSLGSITAGMVPLFPNFTGCLTGTYSHPRVQVSNATSYDALTIERSSDGGSTWQLAMMYDDLVGAIDFTDREVPWDIQILYPITYRIRGYRDADRNFAETITAAWGGTSTAPGQVIGLASNDSGYEFWFTPVTEGTLEMQWTPLSPVSMVQLHGKDYSYAMREAEDRGMSLSVPIIVNQTSFCITAGAGYIANVSPYGEALGKGARSFSPRMYEAFVLPIIRSSARWTLKLPGGHTRTVSVEAGDFRTVTVNGMYLTELVLTDVVEPDPDPYCRGL